MDSCIVPASRKGKRYHFRRFPHRSNAHLANTPCIPPMLKKYLVLVVIVGFAAAVFHHMGSREEAWRPLERSEIDQPEQLDDLHEELRDLNSQPWIRTSLPDGVSPGFNLGLYRRRIPIVFDIDGHIVHSWPKVRAVGRVRLDQEGRLIVIGADNLVKEYDWTGNLMWHFQLPAEGHFPHHDLIRLSNGNILVLAYDDITHTDSLWEVDSQRQVVWTWSIFDHRQEFPNWDDESEDPSHCNSIRELPPNRFFDAGDTRFRPGNILVSARNLNTIFIIDKLTGNMVWQYSKELDRQHEAVMIDRGKRSEGLIIVFNNGLEDLIAYRRSLVQIIDPSEDKVTWDYNSEFFYSAIGGTAQPLPEENVLITSTNSGRAFEITPNGHIVWEWVPPFNPMRLERLPYEHCPQLAALPRPGLSAHVRRAERPFVDTGLHMFDLDFDVETRVINGKKLKPLPSNQECRRLLIPPQAFVKVYFGIDGEKLEGRHVHARFTMTITSDDRPSMIVDKNLDSSAGRLWIRKNFPLTDYAYQYVEMCIATEIDGSTEDWAELAFWANPVIDSKSQHPPRLAARKRISEQERKLRNQQLKALGYIN